MLVADGYDTGGLLAESITQVGREGVSNNYGLISLNPETRMPQPADIHNINLSQAAMRVKIRA